MYTETLDPEENPMLLNDENIVQSKLKTIDHNFKQDQFCYLVWLYTLLIITLLICILCSFGAIDEARNSVTYETWLPIIVSISFLSQFFFQAWAIHKKSLSASFIALVIMAFNALLVSAGTLYYGYEIVIILNNPPSTPEATDLGMRMAMFFTSTGMLLLGVQIGINIKGAIKARKILMEREALKKSVKRSIGEIAN